VIPILYNKQGYITASHNNSTAKVNEFTLKVRVK